MCITDGSNSQNGDTYGSNDKTGHGRDQVSSCKLSKVYREQTGQEAELLSIGGGTYAKACPNLVAFGPLFPGQEMTEHQPDEYMEADTLLKNAQMMAAAIWELAR